MRILRLLDLVILESFNAFSIDFYAVTCFIHVCKSKIAYIKDSKQVQSSCGPHCDRHSCIIHISFNCKISKLNKLLLSFTM